MQQRPLLALLAAWMLPGVGAALVLLWGQPQVATGVMLHALLLLALFLAVLLPSLGDLLLGRWPRSLQWLTAVLLGLLHLVLLAFYAGSAVGQRYWGNWLTLDLTLAYLPQVPALLRVLDVPLGWVALGALLLGGGLVLLYRVLVAGAARARAAHPATVSSRAGLALQLTLLAALMWMVRGWWEDWRFWQAEPLRQASLSTGFWGEGGFQGAVSAADLERNHAAADTYRRQLEDEASQGRLQLRHRPLVLIVVDALRSDVMGAYGAPVDNTPFLSSQLRSGDMRRIDDVYSVCTASYCGILGTLSSRHWFELVPQPWNLADALAALGYESRFLLSGDHDSFFGLRRMFGGSLSLLIDGSSQSRRYVNDDRLVLDALDAHGWPTGRPGFVYIHLMSAHRLGEVQPEHKLWSAGNAPVFSAYSRLDPAQQRAAHARYHNGIRQADWMVEQIFRRLKDLGVLDDALVVLTADHGEHLGEMGLWSHGQLPHEPGVRIPLLIWDRQAASSPPLPPRRLVSQTDIAPTLLRAVGAPVPSIWSGVPLQEPLQRQSLIIESAEATGLVADTEDGRFKYLRLRAGGSEQLLRVLPQGGGESTDLAGRPEHAARLAWLRAEHDRLRSR